MCSTTKKLGRACFVRVQSPVKLQFLPLPFWGTAFESGDDVRAEELLSSAAKIVFLIMHRLKIYTGLMTNSTSYLLLVNSFSKGMLSLQTQESLSELG